MDTPGPEHLIFIPGILLIGIVLGWVGIGIVGLLVLVWFVTVLTI